MNIFVDIDETICFYENKRDYNLAKPSLENINKINILYEKGNKITYWTARGTMTGIDWYETTKKQLDKWGCKYHNLITGQKPAYDLLICDKTKRIEEINV
jgi:hydroxymethylpyrimidine pyrophosphatase-like HAD family hydrolase